MSQRIAYRRVSTVTQSTDRQLADCGDFDREFTDKASGSTADRPQLDAMLAHLRDGDEVVVHSIDRLARNLADLLQLVERINDAGASLRFVKEALHFTGEASPMQELQLSVMGAVAAFERSIINERAAEGRAAAKQRGVRFGRKPMLSDDDVKEIAAQRAAGKSIRAIALNFDVGRATVDRALTRQC